MAKETVGVTMSETDIEIIIGKLSSNVRKVRITALRKLEIKNSELARKHILRLVSDKDKDVRFEALKTINRLCISPESEIIAEILKKEKVSSIKVESAKVLSMIRDRDSIEILIGLIKDKNENVRYWAAKSLGILLPESIDNLIECLGDSVWSVRRLASMALATNACKCSEKIFHALKEGSSEQQFWLLRVIGDSGLNDNNELVASFLKSRNFDLRSASIRALGLLKEEKYLPNLIFLLKSTNSEVRDNAADALVNIGDQSIEPLCRALGSKFWHVRKKASEILTCLGVNNIFPILKVLGSQNRDARFWAARTLGIIGDNRAVRPLLSVLKKSDSELKVSIISALGNIGDIKIIPEIIKYMSHRDERICQAASDVMVKFSDQAVLYLLNALGEESYNLRKYASKSLVKIGDSVVDQVAFLLNDPNPDKSFWAARTLGEIGEKAVEPLGEMLGSGDIDVRLMVLNTLGKTGAEDSIAEILNCLQDEYWSVRKAAAKALGNIGSDKALEGLITALLDEDEILRGLAAEAIGKIGSSASVRYLVPLCDDVYSFTRLKAIEALGNIGDSLGLDSCIEALSDSDESVVSSAVVSIGRIRDVHALPALFSLMEERVLEIPLLEKIIIVLGELGDPRSIKILMPMVLHSSLIITRAASEALAKIGSPHCESVFVEGLKSSDWKTRSNCFKGISRLLRSKGKQNHLKKDKKFINDPDIQFKLAGAFARQGLLDDAVVAYNKALKVNPGHIGAYINLGLIYEEKNMFEDAIECFKKAIKYDGTRPEPHLYLGVTYGLMGQRNRSKAQFKKVVQTFVGTEQARIAEDLLRG